MQSRTSFFNKAIFLNTLKRFWPLWLAYLAFWLLAGPIVQASQNYSSIYFAGREILDLANTGGVIIGIGYSALAAMAVWSFMYNSKTMSGVACLPVKREGVFLSATLAGIVPAVVSNAIVFALCALVHFLRGYGGAAIFDLQAFAIATLTLIFFYGLATLCAQLTGNIIALPAVFLVLNFVAVVVESIVSVLVETICYGIQPQGTTVSLFLSPAMGMLRGGGRTEQLYIEALNEHRTVGAYYQGWGLIIVCALVGIAMLFAAMALYRRRRMESAGDVVAVEILKPVFRYCMCFGCALCSGILFWSILISSFWLSPLAEVIFIILFMLLGAFIGYFAAEMLIRKSFRVFRGRWKGFGISVVIICALMLATEFDLFGIERRVPDIEDVESVEIMGSDYVCYTEPENIAAAIALHGSVVENKFTHERDTGLGSSFRITYQLKNGRSLNRSYFIRYSWSLEDIEALEELQNSSEAISWRKRIPFAVSEDKMLSGSLRGVVSSDELLELDERYTEEDLIIINYYGYDAEYVLSSMSEGEKQELLEDYKKYGQWQKAATHTWSFSGGEMWELYSQCIVPDLEEGKLGKLWIVEDEDYYNTVCSARLTIEMRYTDNDIIASEDTTESTTVAISEMPYGALDTKYYSFFTTPTVGSRTYDWLTDHGVILHTVGEEMEMSGYVDPDYGKYN